MQAVSAIELRSRFERWRYPRPAEARAQARGEGRAGGASFADVLAGEARPGDVLALAGGALVRDANANGRVDGGDGRVDELVSTPLRTRGTLLDVRG
jgi:hypothetical protein